MSLCVQKLNGPKNSLFKRRPFPFPCYSKRPHSECRLMYTGADTCCLQRHALAVTCDHPQHPPVIYNSASIYIEGEQTGSSACAKRKCCAHKPYINIRSEAIGLVMGLSSRSAQSVYCMYSFIV